MTSSAAHTRARRRPSAASMRRPGTARHRRRLPVGVPGTGRQDWQLRHPAPAAAPRTSTPAASTPAMTARIASSPGRRPAFPAASPKQTCPDSARKSLPRRRPVTAGTHRSPSPGQRARRTWPDLARDAAGHPIAGTCRQHGQICNPPVMAGIEPAQIQNGSVRQWLGAGADHALWDRPRIAALIDRGLFTSA
jgi:hypothetical protein